MNLREALEMYQGHQVKVGSEVAFVYCQICDENIYDLMDKLSDERNAFIHEKYEYYKHYNDNFEAVWGKGFKNRITRFKNIQRNGVIKKLKSTIQGFKKLDEEYKQLLIETELLDPKYEEDLNEYIEKIKSRKDEDRKKVSNAKTRYKTYIDTWSPYLERKIVEIYDATLYDARIIKFEGPEHGPYWDKEEYDKADVGITNETH